jgi:hypothetical protein
MNTVKLEHVCLQKENPKTHSNQNQQLQNEHKFQPSQLTTQMERKSFKWGLCIQNPIIPITDDNNDTKPGYKYQANVKHINDLQSTHAETIIPTGKLQIAKTQFLSEKPEAYKFTWQEHKPYTLQ